MHHPIWRPIPGFPAYEVSARGQVRSALTQYVLTPRKGIVALQRDGRGCRCLVRDLVAAAWPAEQTSGVDCGSEPDRTAVCFVTISPAASAELLDLAGEYDCLITECAGLAWENQELQADLTEAQQELATMRASRGVLEERLSTTAENLANLRSENRKQAKELARMEGENARLQERIAELLAHQAQPAEIVIPSGNETVLRLQRQVAELEAELDVYRVSDCI